MAAEPGDQTNWDALQILTIKAAVTRSDCARLAYAEFIPLEARRCTCYRARRRPGRRSGRGSDGRGLRRGARQQARRSTAGRRRDCARALEDAPESAGHCQTPEGAEMEERHGEMVRQGVGIRKTGT